MWNLGARAMGAATAFLFWTLAAHLYPQSVVGGATGIYSVVQLIVFLTGAGLPLVIGRYASGPDRESGTVYLWTLILTTALSALGTLILFAGFHDSLRSELLDHGALAGILAFFLAVNGFSVAAVSEIRLLAARRARAVFLRITAAGVIPILLMMVLRSRTDDALLIAGIWCFGNLVIVTGSMILLRRPLGPHHLRPVPQQAVAAARFASVSMLTQITMFSPLFIVPVMVLAQVSDSQYAVFYLAWGVGTAVFLIPTAIGAVLLVEGGRNQTSTTSDTTVALLVGVGIALIAELGSIPLGVGMALVLGPDYHGVIALVPLFVLAGVPWSITYLLVSNARIHERTRVVWIVCATFALGVLGPAVPLIRAHGAAGAAVAWLLGMVIAAAVAIALSPWRSELGPISLADLRNRLGSLGR
jgi:O-antigen/teichoic acid export membrane protein